MNLSRALHVWLRRLFVEPSLETLRRTPRHDKVYRSKVALLLELLEDRVVPASPVDTWLGTDAYPTFNQGLLGQYWQGANGGSGGPGNFTETQSGMILKSSGAASWIGSATYNPAGVFSSGPIPMTGDLDFPNVGTTGFVDSLGNVDLGSPPLRRNAGDGNGIDNVAARWYGYIYIPNNGLADSSGTNPISFRVGSDDGSVVYIDGGTSGASGTNFTAPGTGTNPQINNAANLGISFKSVTLNLAPGLHAIDVEYFNSTSSGALYFNWDPLGGNAWADVPGSNFSTPAASIPPAGTNGGNGWSNNWSDPHNWSLGRSPINGDTVVFNTGAAGFNPNGFAGTGSPMLSSDFVSLLSSSGNLTLAYNGSLAPSDLVSFNTGSGLASFTYNTAPANADAVFFSTATGITSFTYNGAASASDLLSFTQLQGTAAITYNGAASADDLVSFTQPSGTVLLSYNSTSASSSFTFNSGTTPGQFQSYLATISGLGGSGAALVAGNSGGPFNVHFSGVAGGANLAVVSGPAAVAQAFSYSPATTAAQVQTYLASIPGLTAPNAVLLNGNTGGPINVNFGAGLVGGTQLVASGQAGITQAFLNTPNTTPLILQTYLASIPGLAGAGGVSVNGTSPLAYNVNLGTGGTGGAQLAAVAGGNATINVGAFFNGGATSFDAVGFTNNTGVTAFTYNGGASASDLISFTQAQGTATLTYNSAAAADDLVSFSQASGTILLSYNGSNAPASFPFTANTTTGQFQSYLASIPGLTTAGNVLVSGNTGGPFNVHFAPGLAGGSSLAVVSGPATLTHGFFYSPTTTVAQVNQYLASIPGLTAANAVLVNGNVGGPFNINFGAGIAGGAKLVAFGPATITQAFLNTPNTTAGNLQSYLASLPSLSGVGAVTVTGTLTSGFHITFGAGITGGAFLAAVPGGNATVSVNSFLTAPTATAASFQAYLASIPGLTAAGAVNVNAYQGGPGGPYTVSYGPGVTGDPLLAVVGSAGAVVAPGPAFVFSSTTTPAQFGAYLASLPGLNGPGAVTVTGTTGGPFYVAFGAGIVGAGLLTVANNGPATITQQLPSGTPGAGQWNPVNDEPNLVLNGIVVNNTGTKPSPWYLTGNTVTINNTDTTLTNGISNSTVAYPTNPGLVPPGNPPITTVIALGLNAPGSEPIVLNSNATITDDGPVPTGGATAQSSLLISSSINLNGNTLISGPSAATMLNPTPDTGLTYLAGTIMNADVVTFSAAGTATLAYLGQQAAAPGFAYTAASTAAQFATYLATLPGLAALTSANVFGQAGGPFTVNLGSATPLGTALSVVSGPAIVTVTGMANSNAVVESGYGILNLGGSNSYDGMTSVTSGLLIDGAVNGLGSTLSAAKSVSSTNSFPIAGIAGPGAALGVALGGDTATYNYDVLNFTGGAGTVTLSYNGLQAATAGFAYTATTGAAQLATYLATLPGLTAAGAVTVTGANGGPYNVVFGAGVVGDDVLQYVAGTAVTIAPSNSGVTISGAGISTPALFAGAIVSADGSANTFAAPITLTGAATLASNSGSLTLSGPLSLGSNALTLSDANSLTLNGAIDSTGNASLVKNSTGTATLGADNSAFGTGGSSGATTGLVAGGGITINAGILVSTANQTLGAVTDVLTFAGGAGNYTLGYNGFAATAGQFAYTAATTAAQLQAYLVTIPGLSGLAAANVVAGAAGVFTIYGANITVLNGNATSVTSGGQNVVTVNNGASLGFKGANYLAQQAVNIVGAGVVNGATTDGAIVGTGGTAYFGGALINSGDLYLGATSGTLTLGNNGAPINVAANNLYLVGTGGLVILNAPIVGNPAGSVGAAGGATDNIIKNGASSARFTQSSANFLGTTTINAGEIQAAADKAFGDGTHSAVTALAGGAVGLFSATSLNYATTQALTLIGSGVGGGALENISGNNTFNGVLSFTGATSLGSDAGTMVLSQNISENNPLTFTGAGNSVVTGVISTTGSAVSPGLTESQSSLQADFGSSIGNISATDQVLWPVMGTTAASVPSSYGYYPVGQHIWSNDDTWVYQGLINVPNLTNDVVNYTSSSPGSISLAYNGQASAPFSFDPTPGTGTTAAAFLHYIQSLPGIPTAANQGGDTSGTVNVTGVTGGPFTVVFPTGTAAAGMLTVAAGPANISTVATGKGYLSFAESIADGAQITVDGKVVLHSNAVNQSMGSGELTLSAGFHAIDVRVSNGFEGNAGAAGANSNGWKGFVSGPAPNNTIPNGGTIPYGNGIVFRIDQGPNDPAGIFVGNQTNAAGQVPNGTPGAGSSTSGGPGTGDAGLDYTVPVDPGNGSLFDAPLTITKSGKGNLTLEAANTYTVPTVINGGTLIAANNNALGNNVPLPGTAAVTVNTGGGLALQSAQDVVTFATAGTATLAYSGAQASPNGFAYTAATTAQALQNYLATLPGLGASGAVMVTGNSGGPFTVSFGPGIICGSQLTLVDAGTSGAAISSSPLTLPAVTSISITGSGAAGKGALENIAGNNILNGAITVPNLISGPAAIGSDANLLTLVGNITQNSNLTFTGAGNVAVNGTYSGQGGAPGLLESQASGNIYTGTQTAANLTGYGFDAALYPIMGETVALVPGSYGFYPTASHIWTNNGTFLYQGFINVPNLTSVIFPKFTNTSALNTTLAYNGQLASTQAFSYTSQTTAAGFLAYLNTLPTFPTNAVTVTGPNFAPAAIGGPFYVNFASGTAAANALAVAGGSIAAGALSYDSTGLGYYSFAKSIDDSTWIAVDGAVVLTSTNDSLSLGSGELTLTAGWHAIDLRVANGTGEAGANGSNTNGWSGFVAGGTALLPAGSGNGIVYRIDQGPNDPLGNTTNSGNAANYTIPTDNGSGNLFTFPLTSVVMSGTGTVSLNNAASPGNDAITVNSGTLLATANGALGNNTATVLPIAVLGGTLALAGGATIPANQPLSLAGAGASGGALAVTGGTATITAQTTLLGTGATVFAAPGATLNLAGQILGAGPATLTSTSTFGSLTGTGITILGNAANDYQGATTITGGNLLQITADGDLGANLASAVTINSATLDFSPAANYATTHSYVIGTTGSVIEVDGNGTAVTINSAISGAPQVAPTGALTKTGTGVLALGGANNYGATNVNAGIVQLLNPNALGTGSVTLNGGQLSMLDATPAQGTIPLTSNSFNQDAIWGGSELANLPSAGTTTGLDGTTGFVLYQAGAVFSPAGTGLPANGLVTSSSNPLVNFQLQPYSKAGGGGTVNNTALFSNGGAAITGISRTMTFVTPVSLQTLNLLAISTNGTTSYKMAINFTDNTSDTTNFVTTNGSPYTVADWFSANNNYALQGLGRIDRTGGATYLTGASALANPRLFETDYNLTTATTNGFLDSTKTVASVTFTITGTSAAAAQLGIFALSGQVTPTTIPVLTNAVVVAASSTIDVENSAVTLGPLSIANNQTLTLTSAQGKALTVGATNLPAAANINVASGETLNLGAASDGGAVADLNLTGAGTTNFAAAAASLVNADEIDVSGGGTLNYTNAAGLGTLEKVNVAAGSFLGTASAGLGASGTVGTLSGAGTVTLGANVLTVGSTNNLSAVFSGTIQDGSGTAANDGLTKGGAGSWRLTSASTLSYKGPTTVSQGTLLVDAALANSAVTVAGGATLGGSGPLVKALTANGSVAPGDAGLTSVGTLTSNGVTTFTSTGAYDEFLTGNTVGATNANSKLNIGAAGSLSLGGANLTINVSGTYVANPGDVYNIITLAPGASYDGTTFATFTNNGVTLPITGPGNTVISTNPVTHIQTKYVLSYPASGTAGGNVTLTYAGASGLATHFQVTVSATSTAAGAPVSVTVSALDANNLYAANYTGTVRFTSTDLAALGAGLLPPTYTFTSGSTAATDNSIHTFTNVTFITAGPETVTATDVSNNTITGTSPVVTVAALPQTAHFVIVPSSGSAAPGVPLPFTVTPTDIYGNVTTYQGTIQFSSSDPTATFGTNTVTFNTPGVQTISARDTVSLGTTGIASVNVAALAQKIVITPSSLTTTAGNALPVTVQLQDIYGNPAILYSGTATITVSGGNATVPTTVNLVNGTAAFNVNFKTAGGPFTISANYPGIFGTSAGITVTPAGAAVFAVTAPAGTETTGPPFNVTVTALDLYNNVATSYAGTMKLTSSDPKALSLVSGYTFTTGAGGDNGVHTFSVALQTGGTQFITAADLNSTNPIITGTTAGITTRGLMVTSFTPTPTGFTAAFNKSFLPSDLFLYNSNLTTVADITMFGSGGVGNISGTLLIDPTNTIMTFKATASKLEQKNSLAHPTDPSYTSVVLPDATYTITLVSGQATNGFMDSLGVALDGANNGGHANFVTTFTTHYQANATPALGIPDFARGPDNSSGGNMVNGGVSTIEVPNEEAAGIPITLYNSAHVTDVFFTLTYNPALLSHLGAFGHQGSDATDQGSSLILVSDVGGVATFHYTDATALSATPDAPLVLGDITAIVPSSGTPNALSLYQAKELLQLGGTGLSFSVNGVTNANWAVADGVHVNAYFGDLNGDKVINGLDKLAANNVATGAATGFSAYTQLDPVIIGDVAGDLSIDAGDVSTLDAYVALLSPIQIPESPTQLPAANPNYVDKNTISSPNAADPTLSLPGSMQANSAGIVDVPVLLDNPHPIGSTGLTEASLCVTYDPTVLSVTPADITLGSIPSQGTGWQLSATVDAATGQIGITLFSSTPIASPQPGSLVNIAFHVVPGGSVSTTAVQLVDSATPDSQRFDTVLLDAQGGLILSQGADRLAITTGIALDQLFIDLAKKMSAYP